MIISITGHRPHLLQQSPEEVRAALKEAYEVVGVEKIYQGMASGSDLWSAGVAWQLGIPYIAVIPFRGHTPNIAVRPLYDWVLEHAEQVITLNPSRSYPSPFVYHQRNEYMVANSEAVIAVWNGGTSGGTAACVRYAKSLKRPIYQISPQHTGWV